MIDGCSAWLVFNSASGSNDAPAQSALTNALSDAGCKLDRTLYFPKDDAPSADELRRNGVDLVVVFAGDGTISAVVTKLFGWDGAVLVLPGGTMNLLASRLHGDASPEQIIDQLGNAAGRKVRPHIIAASSGPVLTGVLAGPGTSWNNVREAMREAAVPDMVGAASEAIAESVGGAKVICNQPACGREEGYAAIMVTPDEDGLEVRGYDAQNFADYASQAMALLQGDFRDGPHDLLGMFDKVELACPESDTMDLLVDGEPSQGGAFEVFTVINCGVDLLATIDAG